MEIICNTLDFKLNTETAVALGKFDGLHIGHRRLLQEILEKKKEGLAACVFTFDPSPAVFFGFSDGREITSKEEKRELFAGMGVDILVEFPMTKETADMAPEAFVEEILVKKMNTRWIAAGNDLSFGKKGAGDEALLRKLAEKYGYGVTTIEKIRLKDREVSSTYIRELVDRGDMETAEKFLGAPYTIMGTVAHGKKLGRKLGMPTVNLIPAKDKLLPPNGVYYSAVRYKGKIYPAISNIGYKPTVSEEKCMGIESYLYDFHEEIYGEQIEVSLFQYKRGEMQFESVDKLQKQMQTDIEEGKCYHLSKKG